mgnify:CR=1 FL=1
MVIPSLETLLAIDAGNTRVKLGVMHRPASLVGALPECNLSTAVAVGETIPWDELAVDSSVPAVITGSNPGEIERIRGAWPADRSAPSVLTDREEFPIVIDVDFPEKVGIDRLLNAVAANSLRRPNQRVVIVDSGTATTVDCIDAEGHFCGGAILPGFDLCAKALHQYTALLPMVEASTVLDDDGPPSELGRNTQAAIAGGLYWGHVGAVKELVHRLSVDADQDEPLLLLTGGAAPLLQPHLSSLTRRERNLSLQGLTIAVMSHDRFRT